jgi:protocatechuate 3,4-dioxygenase beta subunit
MEGIGGIMVARRDILLGVGASAGCTVLGFAGLATRPGAMEYGFGQVGTSLENETIANLACTGGKLTTGQQDGPFYTPNSPLRRDIRNAFPQMATFLLTGRVVDGNCQPISGAVIDFWQTGDDGGYDNQGYGYRGHQFTDEQGRFQLVTVRPSAYAALGAWRTPHFHVKVQGPDTPLLTTQLYMPDENEFNGRDGGFDPALAVRLAGKDGDAEHASFDFVMARS